MCYKNDIEFVYVFITNLKISNIFKNPLDEKYVYNNSKELKINYYELISKIDRRKKLKKIKEKINI